MKQAEMFGDAKWVCPSTACEAPLIRGVFQVNNCKKAEITLCGLGFFELYLNGDKVSDDRFVPAYTDYENRPHRKLNYPISDKQSHRALCLTYDLSGAVKDGDNTLGVILGNGWYNQYRHRDEGNVEYGSVKLCFRLRIEDDAGVRYFVSDETLQWKQSHITSNNIYFGERHDYRLYDREWAAAPRRAGAKTGFAGAGNPADGNPADSDPADGNPADGGHWRQVALAKAPETEFFPQECEGDAVIEYLTPTLVRDFGDVRVYDAGRNISGYPVVTCDRAGEAVTVLCAENLNADQTLNFDSCDGVRQPQKDEYISDGSGMEMHPKFTWHAFRYFSLTGGAECGKCAVVHANIARNSSFESDNETLNWLYRAYIDTQRSNMHAGVPSDCPHIERLGYTGDGQLCCETAMLLLDAKRFYRKWIDDIADCQDKNTGHVQHTAPFAGGGGGPGGWGCAIIEVPYVYYKQYGDTDVLKQYLPNMTAYLNYMESRCEGGLVVREEPGGWCVGEWCTKEEIKLPEPYVNTYFYIKSMKRVREIALLLDQPSCVPLLDERLERCERAMKNAYYSEQTHNFIGNIQGANAFAVDLGLGSPETYRNLYRNYKDHTEYDTGIFGTDILTRVLFERGNAQLAYSLLTNEREGSYYNMKKNGATTLWEYWHGARSHNHPMFGAAAKYLFFYLLGIRQREGSAGYEQVVIDPRFVLGLNKVKGHITTPKGAITVAYERTETDTRVEITLENEMDAYFLFEAQKYDLRKGNNVLELQKILY